jgi:hypothetical protein
VEELEEGTLDAVMAQTGTIKKKRFQALTATGKKIYVVWKVAECSLVETDRHFRVGYAYSIIMAL